MGTPHKHRDAIIAWANGAEVEYWNESLSEWREHDWPRWYEHLIYRIKPKRVKKEGWVNVYRNDVTMHDTKEKSDECACALRVACVRIEWEEDA